MHIPDGFIDGPTSAAAGLVAVGGVAASVRRAGRVLDDHQIPLAGLISAFVFALQMLNFPVASGTSGHVIGGVLAAVLVGPWLGSVCITVVVVVQTLLFADGGLSALGLNILNVSVVATLVGCALFVAVRALLPRRPTSIVVASGVAAGMSVVIAAVAFAIEFAVGGTTGASATTVGAAMVGAHVLIGVGEGIVTAMVVRAVLSARPDLVWGAQRLLLPRMTIDRWVEEPV